MHISNVATIISLWWTIPNCTCRYSTPISSTTFIYQSWRKYICCWWPWEYVLMNQLNSFFFQLSVACGHLVIKWFENGLSMETFHVVSHSFGCRIAGILSRSVQANSIEKYRVRRLTLLDPQHFKHGTDPTLKLNYSTRNHEEWAVLSESDAVFVDAYHTMYMEEYIYPCRRGSIDIWINDPDELQPNCNQGRSNTMQ